MTAKRFKFICDDEKCFFKDGNKALYCYEVVDLLNSLSDENEQLEEAREYYQENFLTMKTERNQFKRENELLKFQLDECRNNKLFSRRELEKENEQLKEDIENLKITIKARETLIDVCEKKFNELGYIITVDDDGYVIE